MVGSLSPEKWLLNRHLEAAYDLLNRGNIGVTVAAYKVGARTAATLQNPSRSIFGKSP